MSDSQHTVWDDIVGHPYGKQYKARGNKPEPVASGSPRYRDYADRLDLVICGDCSTRATLAVVPRDEIEQHDEWHAANA